MKKILIFILVFTFALWGCHKDEKTISEPINYNSNIFAIEYDDINSIENTDLYLGEAATNLPVENGVIISPYYALTINGQDIKVYATRTTNTIHSFAYIDVEVIDKEKDFLLDICLDVKRESSVLTKKNPSVTVLPEKHGVVATLKEGQVRASINDFGSYSFVFNKKQDEALTLIIAKKEDKESLFLDKEIQYIVPDDYSTEKKDITLFTEENKVYYFQKGRHQVDSILVPDNSIIYLEQGAYLEVIPTTRVPVLKSTGLENIKIMGRGLIDFSACCGSEVPDGYYNNKGNRGALVFFDVKNIEFSGITVINAQTWTLCFYACDGVYVHDTLLFGYRVFSDGIMLSDCKNGLVENNFVRTGDDAFETKSNTTNGLTENVLFRNNDAWTDKGVAYGCIYESTHDTTGVRFENCTVGFALGSWSNHLGCCVIQMGNRKDAKMYDIYFDNIEIFASHNDAILNIYVGGSAGRGEGYGHVDNIYFSNISAKRNYGAILNLRTYDSLNCSIKNVYVDNIYSNNILLTNKNYLDAGYVNDKVVGGYDFNYLHINTRIGE